MPDAFEDSMQRDESVPYGVGEELHPRIHAESPVEAGEARFDRDLSEAQLGGHLLVAQPLMEHAEEMLIGIAQRIRR
jgi:hypothetical protein